MNAFSLFRLLRKNNNLEFRRSPAYEQSMVAKVLMGIGACIFVLYLIIYGTMFGSIASSNHEPGFIMAILPVLLIIDFGLRFMVQQTPAMLVKPYMLLPVQRKRVIDTFLITSLLSIYNFLWLSLLLPYLVIVLAGGCEWGEACSLLCSGILLIMLNSQIYLLVRTLVARNLFWWLMPILIYGAYFVPLLIDQKGNLFDDVLDVVRLFGMHHCEGEGYPHTLGRLVTDVFNMLPRWDLNGWSLAENTARVTGRPPTPASPLVAEALKKAS